MPFFGIVTPLMSGCTALWAIQASMHLSGDDLTPISCSLPPIPSPGRKAQTDLDDGAISKKTLEITHHTHFVNILRKVVYVLHPSGCIKMFQMKLFLTATKFPNTELFLVSIFLYSDQKKLRICALFKQCLFRISQY